MVSSIIELEAVNDVCGSDSAVELLIITTARKARTKRFSSIHRQRGGNFWRASHS